MKYLTILTLAFCLKPIQTNAVLPQGIDNETVWEFAIAAYKVGLQDGKTLEAAKSRDLELKRLTVNDIQQLIGD